MAQHELSLMSGDVVVVSSKIVSRTENRFVALATIEPSPRARELAEVTRKDARIVELILRESQSVSRVSIGVLVTENRLGFISANAGIDQSNVGQPETVLLLPEDPDRAARQLREQLQLLSGTELAVIISDTHGRPFRLGNVGVAIGSSGIAPLFDQRGEHDLFGRELQATIQGTIDLVASSAHLLCGEGAEGLPVVVVRGLVYRSSDEPASTLYRDPAHDLYR